MENVSEYKKAEPFRVFTVNELNHGMRCNVEKYPIKAMADIEAGPEPEPEPELDPKYLMTDDDNELMKIRDEVIVLHNAINGKSDMMVKLINQILIVDKDKAEKRRKFLQLYLEHYQNKMSIA
jgi:hypothetical protein